VHARITFLTQTSPLTRLRAIIFSVLTLLQVQEIIAKAPVMPADIKWHFIGHLQSNKCKVVAAVPNLFVVETVDSEKLATQLQKACVTVGRASRLRVLVQVNTSGEESKFGCAPADTVAVATYIAQRCPNLELAGLMTIGRLEAEPAPECFEVLLQCRQRVSDALQISIDSLELSMGMSGDLELACAMGSTNVRVGSAIFGHRDYGIKIKPESDDERPAADESAAAASKSA
jgi:pyridoxal phosphate enzyme (YggS family)